MTSQRLFERREQGREVTLLALSGFLLFPQGEALNPSRNVLFSCRNCWLSSSLIILGGSSSTKSKTDGARCPLCARSNCQLRGRACAQLHAEVAALTHGAFDVNRAAHRSHEVVNDCQAEAKAAGGARTRGVGAIEAIEDAL